MTCYFDPSGTTMDVYDHEGTIVGESVEFGGSWTGEYPQMVLDVLYEARDGNTPNAYNQELLFCLAAEQIEEGTPP